MSTSMKRLLILGAGGAPACNFIRSLRQSKERFYLVGTDGDPYRLQRSEADKNYLVPMASEKEYLPVINAIIKKERIQLIHTQNDYEIAYISKNRDKLGARIFLPNPQTVQICQDKFASYLRWQQAGMKVPKTILLNSKRDLVRAFRTLGKRIWIRATFGAAGKGSLATDNLETAQVWIETHQGWGNFSAAEVLSDKSVTWMSLWYNGKLIVAQGRSRLYWEMAHLSPTGITGITGGGMTMNNPKVDAIALRAIGAIDPSPHGLFGVDLCIDKNGTPNPTEINIGRFFTTHHFFTAAGLNMPYMYVKLAYQEPIPKSTKTINPLPTGLLWIRGMDRNPVFTTQKAVQAAVTELAHLKKQLQKSIGII